jgi:hypothetical protein
MLEMDGSPASRPQYISFLLLSDLNVLSREMKNNSTCNHMKKITQNPFSKEEEKVIIVHPK